MLERAEARLESSGGLLGHRLRTGECAESPQRAGQIRKARHLLLIEGNAECADLRALSRIAPCGPGDDDIRPQRDETLHVDGRHISDAWHCTRGGRLARVLHGGDELSTRTRGEQHFGCARRQAHNSQRRAADLDDPAKVVRHRSQRCAGRRSGGRGHGIQTCKHQYAQDRKLNSYKQEYKY